MKKKHKIAFFLWGRPFARFRSMPDFIGLGAQRSGTSTLNHYLSQHPQFRSPIRKEVHYFDKNFYRGLNWYKGYFPLRTVNGNTVTGEVSPFYLFHPYCPERIAADLPDARFIVLLRNPVRRAVSHYWKQYTTGFETLGIEEAVNAEEERLAPALEKIKAGKSNIPKEFQKFSYVSRGHYAEQLSRYFNVMDRGRFLVLQSEAFWREPVKYMNRVCEFLKIKPLGESLKAARRGASKPQYDVPDELIERLTEYYKPLNKQLYELLGEEWDW